MDKWSFGEEKEQITERQQETIKIINDVLDMRLRPRSKKEAWAMINKYMDKSKKVSRENSQWMDEDDCMDFTGSVWGD